LAQFLACIQRSLFLLVRLGDVTQHLVHCCCGESTLDAPFPLFSAYSLSNVTHRDVHPVFIGLLA
jgi:hypothetical protein